MPKIYARCPEGVKVPYLTAGKLYEVVSDDGHTFNIIDDEKFNIWPNWV